MIKPKFKGIIKNGKLDMYNLDRFKEYFKKFEGKDVAITIDKWSSIRSLQQNNYLHGVVFKMIADETGYTIPEVKDKIKVETGFVREIEAKGEKILVLKETSQLSKKEFGEFVDACRDWAIVRLKLNIPSPDEVDYESLYYVDNC